MSDQLTDATRKKEQVLPDLWKCIYCGKQILDYLEYARDPFGRTMHKKCLREYMEEME